MIVRLTSLLLVPMSIWAAEFYNGQAARAVIGQPSFSALEPGIAASSLLLSNGRLYVTDTAHRLLVLDLAKIPGVKGSAEGVSAGCAVCGFSPAALPAKSVLQGSPAVSIYGNTVVLADTSNHRVLIWRDTTAGAANHTPNIVLGQSNSEDVPVSGRTLIEPISVAFDGKRLFVADGALRRVLIWNSLPTIDNQPADSVLGQQNLTSIDMSDMPRADTVHYPAALASDGTNLFVADPIDRRILVFTAANSLLPKNTITNSASLTAGPLAPGTLITISANGLADGNASAPDDNSQPLPTKLGNTEVIFDGIALPLLSVSPTQVRAQLPYAVESASAASLYVRVEHNDGRVSVTSAAGIQIVPANPGLFAFGGPEPRSGLALHASTDGAGESGIPVTPENPARPGETLIVWGTGLGAVKEAGATAPLLMGIPLRGAHARVIAPVSALVNGRSAQVAFAGLPQGSIGIYEVHVVLPPDLQDGPKTLLLITQNGYVSNKITVPVQNTSR